LKYISVIESESFRLEPNVSPRKTTNRRSKSVMNEKRMKKPQEKICFKKKEYRWRENKVKNI
jgi:hypothetical protein